MHLKRLESVGFKSFAERIKVDFVPGMTAIVGPNGSGKSNITDAIRWVLGEQSAKSLRGSKMEDIIFQGSDTRNKLNVAEVTLVLDNSDGTLPLDYEEVSVTRRVYRSGESEFYINKQACRLKDIIDLFMDSGLGKEAFSIISQGRVEEILSSKAEERRVIFEEAAGVLKYKQRKKQAEFKLAETAENLHRVEDIIYEIEQQLDPLKEQAETAKEYKRLREKLKQHDISLLVTEIDHLHRSWKQLKAKFEHDETEELRLKTYIQKNEALILEKRHAIKHLDGEIEQHQAELLEITQKLEQAEGQKKVLHERHKHVAENKEKLIIQQNEINERCNELKIRLDQEDKTLQGLKAERNEIKVNVRELETKLSYDIEEIESELEQLKAEYIEYLNRRAADSNEKQSIEQQLSQMEVKTGKLTERKSSLDRVYNQLILNKKTAQQNLTQLQKVYQENEQKHQRLKNDMQKLTQNVQVANEKLIQGDRYIDKLNSKKEMLEEMKNDFQGFYHGAKSVLQAWKKGNLKEIHGPVIDLISIPQQYTYAIETILGGQAQHIVTTDDIAARGAIQWLKETNNGRATFLPLQSIQERFIPNHLRQLAEAHSGYIGIASELVQTTEPFQKIIGHLMGHVIVARTLKDANDINRLTERRFRIVTLDGDVVFPGGSMSGGAKRKQSQSLFTRDREITQLAHQLTEFKEKRTQFVNQLEEKRETLTHLKERVQTLEKGLYSDYQQVQEAHTKVKQLETKLLTTEESLHVFQLELDQSTADRENLQKRAEEITEQLQETNGKLKLIHSQIDQLTKEKDSFYENQEELKQAYQKARILLAEKEERTKNQFAQTQSIKEQLEAYEQQYEKTKFELNSLTKASELQQSESNLVTTIKQLTENKGRLINVLQTKRTHRMEETTQIQDQERELKEEEKLLENLSKQVTEHKVQLNRLDVALENRLSHLETEYIITFDKARELYGQLEDVEAGKRKVDQIKAHINQLGTVNLGAIDEFERIRERYDFLTTQQKDLVEAKQTLYDVIEEMDTEMKRLFDETFSQIRAEFSVVFKQLFGGGRAELQLTDPKNLLDTGVDIIAQPPGKKLQNLGLLSGGERALTAIALLFAILRVRPVPFCVLDEVEAALDEANVVRFAKYVKQHSHETQFIVITHRKGTMEEADVLYGVTMQESGVSRFVSVRLEESEEFIKV
ncbi:MAG TPA: chromosome segregation protein SMC [Cerasibacillus sp.]|uniref:chromosome segregation protein SMC n=1 Tax=Cerasibacillus sp. TaxID=2498711 RepID=UPI002F40FC16